MLDLRNHEPQQDFAPMPAGNYCAEVKSVEIKTSQNNTEYLAVCVEITENNFQGRLLFENINLWHEKEQVRNIAKSTIVSMMLSSGIGREQMSFPDRQALIDCLYVCKNFIVRLGIKDDPEHGKQNKVKGYMHLNDVVPQSQSQQTGYGTTQPPVNNFASPNPDSTFPHKPNQPNNFHPQQPLQQAQPTFTMDQNNQYQQGQQFNNNNKSDTIPF